MCSNIFVFLLLLLVLLCLSFLICLIFLLNLFPFFFFPFPVISLSVSFFRFPFFLSFFSVSLVSHPVHKIKCSWNHLKYATVKIVGLAISQKQVPRKIWQNGSQNAGQFVPNLICGSRLVNLCRLFGPFGRSFGNLDRFRHRIAARTFPGRLPRETAPPPPEPPFGPKVLLQG